MRGVCFAGASQLCNVVRAVSLNPHASQANKDELTSRCFRELKDLVGAADAYAYVTKEEGERSENSCHSWRDQQAKEGGGRKEGEEGKGKKREGRERREGTIEG